MEVCVVPQTLKHALGLFDGGGAWAHSCTARHPTLLHHNRQAVILALLAIVVGHFGAPQLSHNSTPQGACSKEQPPEAPAAAAKVCHPNIQKNKLNFAKQSKKAVPLMRFAPCD